MFRIRVIDRDGFTQGWVDVREGLPTYRGPVTRWTAKGSFYTLNAEGHERLWKVNCHQPSVYKSKLRKSDIIHERSEG
uniref:Uncharacterized protein n=1 Tax=Caulobacter phage BL57 TaxID=3348355 RepID=A0AB74UMW4_9VIRU